MAGLSSGVPTTLYITHAKAGSVWLTGLLEDLFGAGVQDRLPPEQLRERLKENRLPARGIHPAMFLTRSDLRCNPAFYSAPRFVVLRDLRDTLVSLYFSLKVSHPENEAVHRDRARLNSLPEEEGLLFCIQERAHRLAELQLSWTEESERLYRYEDLMADTFGQLKRLFSELRLPCSDKKLRAVVEKHSFEKRFRRELGKEDVRSHGRQGSPGDWKRRFSPRLAEAFAQRYGSVLVATGYEKDNSWAGGDFMAENEVRAAVTAPLRAQAA